MTDPGISRSRRKKVPATPATISLSTFRTESYRTRIFSNSGDTSRNPARFARQSQFMTNTPRDLANWPVPRVAANGAVAQEVRCARDIGPLNAIERSGGDHVSEVSEFDRCTPSPIPSFPSADHRSLEVKFGIRTRIA